MIFIIKLINNLKNRRHESLNHVTLTFEMFKPDKYENTFTFTDFDFNANEGTSKGNYQVTIKWTI
ncbi:hypothetical protein ACFQ5N_02720 [Lutibacter holmesii]|uniref:Uncharacterized protein n=1 Tax=Lutibacter holmesii TaxID=1137985 RepID=A0ABW3WLG7_9FLAO